jgi:hypothetical protein
MEFINDPRYGAAEHNTSSLKADNCDIFKHQIQQASTITCTAMRPITALILSLSFLAVPHAALAASPSEALGTCLVDNTTGKDRKELARWIFMAVTAHPDIRELSAATEEQIIQSNKNMATLVTRLLTENGTTEVRAARNEGGGANTNMFQAFKSLGEVAMQELMGNRNVAKAVGDYVQYLDKKKLEGVLSTK